MRRIHSILIYAQSLAALATFAAPTRATTFFDDLAAENGGTEIVSGDRWMAGVFTTDDSSYTALSATLLLAQTSAGTAQLDLYSDGSLEPESFIASFNSPASYSATLVNSTFTLSGLSLSANTNYWLVLSTASGEFEWGWTSDFLTTNGWADSPDAGETWFGSDVYPLQYSVVSGVTLIGDYNYDGLVDTADYTVWRDSLDETGENLAADGDKSGAVDEADYTLWKNNFGTGSTGASSIEAAVAAVASGTVPEPTSAALLAAALTLCLLMLRHI